jgi:DNA-binding PadR family transcriptional regulator
LLEFIILGFLMEREFTGYDIKQKISISTINFYEASFGSIYPALKRLEKDGLIDVREKIEAGRLKKYYRIREAGRERFQAWLEEPMVVHPSRHEHLVKLFFFGLLPRERARELIAEFIRFLQQKRERIAGLKSGVEDRANEFQLATLQYGVDYYRFMQGWFENYLSILPDRRDNDGGLRKHPDRRDGN